MCAKVDARDLAFGKETLFVNASIMNLRYQARNAPWCVDLLLPEAQVEEGEERTGEEWIKKWVESEGGNWEG